MGKIWVLDTGTKGTGAEMVPLEKVLKKPASKTEADFDMPIPPAPAPAGATVPRAPRRFKVVDVMTGEVLTEDADARATVDFLDGVRSVVDVRVYTWQPRAERWRLLTVAEQKAMWELRGS
jgi:hypothetical protein